MFVKIPVGVAAHRGDDACVRPQQWLHLVDDIGYRMRLQADDDNILHAELGRSVGAARAYDPGLIADQRVTRPTLTPTRAN